MHRPRPMSPTPLGRLTLVAMDAVFVCDVGAIVEPDVAAVDALARLQLAARRAGCLIDLQGVAPGLGDLLELMGLAEIFPCHAASGGGSSGSAFEARREAEQREQPPRVEEEADPGDAVVADLEDLE
jgi:ABC-type transporter Mla MlaB component